MHSARCFTLLPQVFDPQVRPWVVADAADADELAEVIMQCPSGALHFRRLDGGPQEQPDDRPPFEPHATGRYSSGAASASRTTRAPSSEKTPASPSAAAAARRTSPSATAPTAPSTSRRTSSTRESPDSSIARGLGRPIVDPGRITREHQPGQRDQQRIVRSVLVGNRGDFASPNLEEGESMIDATRWAVAIGLTDSDVPVVIPLSHIHKRQVGHRRFAIPLRAGAAVRTEDNFLYSCGRRFGIH